MSVFADMTFDEERRHIMGIAEWTQRKATRGYHAVDWPIEYGGLGIEPRPCASPRSPRA